METVWIVLLAIMLSIWIVLGQERYRKLAGKGHWGHAVVVGMLTLLLIVCEYPYRDLRGNFGMDDVVGIAIYALLMAGVVAHGLVAAKIRRREHRE